MSNLSDIVTIGKNIVTAIASLAGATNEGLGNITSATVTSATLITTGTGRLVNVSVVVKGTGNGTISNAATVATAAAGNALYTVSDAAIGILPIGVMYNLGLVVSPGTGQSLNVTYYQV